MWLSEPRVHGHSLSAWLRTPSVNFFGGDFSTDLDLNAEQATNAIHQIGVRAIPVLLRKLQATDGKWKRKLADFAQGHRWFTWKFHWAGEDYQQALTGFRILGPKARDAIPQLAQLLLATNTAERAGPALAAIGVDSVPVLRSALTNAEPIVRLAAMEALTISTNLALLSLPDMPRLLNDPDASIASLALSQIAWVAPLDQSLPVLTNALNDRRLWFQAVRRLGALGTNARVAAPFLVPLLTADAHPLLARLITNALIRIDPEVAAAAGVNTNPIISRTTAPANGAPFSTNAPPTGGRRMRRPRSNSPPG
jgi:hypothetical protein